MPYPKDYKGNCSAYCGKPATRWIDIERFGRKRFVSWPYCDDHGDELLQDPSGDVTTRPLDKS
ncbi:hypothetical protein HKX69_05935 [Streptomyces argyrophyllae]|uniref:Acetone carboxylase n=1 Tax=Streptomyces argyrophylli TaxID=2726118 RepID=A0A6M4PFU0_9ACTN|nr:hypothetical protein [Streptomyces argyrophyllae]QJS09113.1 hypothetical protein HKX69_05935 [Streptomyces argyrophyllae]